MPLCPQQIVVDQGKHNRNKDSHWARKNERRLHSPVWSRSGAPVGSGDTCWCRTGLIYVCCPGGIINSALLPSKANEVESKLYGYLMHKVGSGGDSLKVMAPFRGECLCPLPLLVSDSTLWDSFLIFFPLQLKRGQENKPFLGAARLLATPCL